MPSFSRIIHAYDVLHALTKHSQRAQNSLRTPQHMRKATSTHCVLQYDKYIVRAKPPCKRK